MTFAFDNFPHSHYEVLGLHTNATTSVVVSAYETLIAECLNEQGHLLDEAYSDYANRLHVAYTELIDPVLRRRHDLQLKATTTNNPQGAASSPIPLRALVSHKLPLLITAVLLALALLLVALATFDS